MNGMSPMVIVAIIVAVAAVGLVGYYVSQRRQTDELRARYGPEYHRALDDMGDRRSAEAELLERQERVEHLDIHPLTAQQREHFVGRWRNVQSAFVDDPQRAVSDADHLVEAVMKARGYPIEDFDQRAADLSVHHPLFVEHYRVARDIAQRHRRGEASTEDLRHAMVHYRALFGDMLEDRERARNVEREVPLDVAMRSDLPTPPVADRPAARREQPVDMRDERDIRSS